MNLQQSFTLTKNEIIEVNNDILNLYKSKKIRRAINNSIVEPLSHDAVELFTVALNHTHINNITKEESEYLKYDSDLSHIIEIIERKETLQIVGVTFQEKNKWRFSSGDSLFYAEIEDKHFLEKVDNGEAFAKGDLLQGIIQVRKTIDSPGALRSEPKIIKVLKHFRLIQGKLTEL